MGQGTSIRFKGVLPGRARGTALVFRDPISFHGEIDEEGRIVGAGNPHAGESVAGKILVYPEAKGSSGGCMMLRLLAKRGKKPAAIVNMRNLDPNLVEGAILADIPLLCFPQADPYQVISTGDVVEVDGEIGLLTKVE